MEITAKTTKITDDAFSILQSPLSMTGEYKTSLHFLTVPERQIRQFHSETDLTLELLITLIYPD